MRWNNGRLVSTDTMAFSEMNFPQDSRREVPIGSGVPRETVENAQRLEVRRSMGRFTAKNDTSYVWSDIRPLERQRRDFGLRFVDFVGGKVADGGDVRDANALGGGMPEARSGRMIGRGVPSRKSVFNRLLSRDLDHDSPVPRK